jgi:hypothetical protein
VLDRRSGLRRLVNVGELIEVAPPLRARMVYGDRGQALRVEESPERMYLDGGPFYLRTEVLALRQGLRSPRSR